MTYRLKALMNIRREPSVESEKMGQKKEGALVSVISLENDWLAAQIGKSQQLDNITICCGGGESAEKV